jgi:hypothetical protein
LLLLAACADETPSPSAQEKYDELMIATRDVSTGSEFLSAAIQLGHQCERRWRGDSRQIYTTDSGLTADETLICTWDESLSGLFDVVFGTAFSVVHLYEDRIVERDSEVIYTGP